ncbi:MAG: hypothetical protein VYD53_18200 [Pseudomonadota bacterium]|nr:hypothetical protein [Pseudomonadota bacterium]
METVILFLIAIVMYAGLYWFSYVRTDRKPESVYFFLSTVCCVTVLSIFMLLSLFWVLFIAALILAIASYLGSNTNIKNSAAFKNGVFGGVWLMVPIYAYLAQGT